MQKYRSHKVVEAGQINAYATSGPHGPWADVGAERFKLPSTVFARGTPQIGDYLVQYLDGNGYLSWSPKAVFEAGYTEIGEADPVDVELVYEILERSKPEANDTRGLAEKIVRALKPYGALPPLVAVDPGPIQAPYDHGPGRVGEGGVASGKTGGHAVDLRDLPLSSTGLSIFVPVEAWGWLMGECPDRNGRWFGMGDADASASDKPKFWWRSAFRRLVEVKPMERTPTALELGAEVRRLGLTGDRPSTDYGRSRG